MLVLKVLAQGLLLVYRLVLVQQELLLVRVLVLVH